MNINLKTVLLTSILSLSTMVFGSKIRRLSFAELERKADLIVMGQVTILRPLGNIDSVTIKIGSCISGIYPQDTCTFFLNPRGDKDFDPALKVGDSGVFFLKKKGDKVAKAYWGSIAIFPKNNFVVADRPIGLPVPSSAKRAPTLNGLPSPDDVFVISCKPGKKGEPAYFTPETLLNALSHLKRASVTLTVDAKWQCGVIVLKDKSVLYWRTCGKWFVGIDGPNGTAYYAMPKPLDSSTDDSKQLKVQKSVPATLTRDHAIAIATRYLAQQKWQERYDSGV